MAAKAKELIKAASIARYTDKAGKFLGFGVKSNRGKGYYEIHCTKEASGAVVYTCDCEAKEWGHPVCNHIKAVVELVEARKALQLDTAAVVAPLVLGQFSEDLPAHLDDEFAGQPEPPVRDANEDVYAALTFGTVVDLHELGQALHMDEWMLANCITVLRRNKRIVTKQVAEGVLWVDTPAHAYSDAYAGDFNTAA